MTAPRFAIGIDLGTTNCALAYVDLRDDEGRPQILPIPQLESLDRVIESPLLPSFFYYATELEAAQGWRDVIAGVHSADMGIVVGTLARERMTELPGRVIHSAKSWLAHAGVDREAQILPFASEDVPQALRLSPAEASAAYLDHLKRAWDAAFAQNDPENAFVRQRVVITVPASFDESAQALTRRAAQLAGYPRNVRLLEEPQAAFYAWLAAGPGSMSAERLRACLPLAASEDQTVLVCDIGGGTSDFSLFRVAALGADDAQPAIERVATSEHLLLGGDNIDLALAHALEQQLVAGREDRLSRRQWQHLLPQARRLKELALQELPDGGDADEAMPVALPGDGGSLFASALSASLTRQQIRDIVLEGFYPQVPADTKPRLRSSGLREMGLPYAADSAITRHLCGFLAGRRPDAILFVGGSLQSQSVRERLLSQLEAWQNERPTELALADMNLAVALGAAHYAALGAKPAAERERIKSGYPRSVHLELSAEREQGRLPKLVCVLPQGTEEGSRLVLDSPSFELLVNQPARFSAWTSLHHAEAIPGALTDLDLAVFHALPPLFATIVVDESSLALRGVGGQHVRVGIEASLSELGALQLSLVAQETGQRWELEFNLRQPVAQADQKFSESEAAEAGSSTPAAPPRSLESAQARIALFFGKKQTLSEKEKEKAKVKMLPKDLEKILGSDRSNWDLNELRALWPELQQGITRRARSLDHENVWLYLAGFFLRPGYGSDLDPWRMAQLWECFDLGLAHPREKSAQSNWWMMWRRTAGGLPVEQQEVLFDAAHPLFMQSPADFVEGSRLLGSLERVAVERRQGLAERLAYLIEKGRAAKLPHLFWTFSRLLSRVPLYGSADAVVPASLVESLFARLEPLDWRNPELHALVSVFASACRRTDVRILDVDDAIRARVLAKLRQSGARAEQVCVVEEYREITRVERNELFGEALPAGLRLASI